MALWHCSLSFSRLEKNKLKKLIVRNVLKGIICLEFADFPELLVFTSIIVVDIYVVGCLDFTSFFSNVCLVNWLILFFWISKTVRKKCFASINFYSLWYNYSIKILGNDISYRFTTKYVTTTPIRKSRTQNALRIPLNSDIMFFSVTVTFFTKKKINKTPKQKQIIDAFDIKVHVYVSGYER